MKNKILVFLLLISLVLQPIGSVFAVGSNDMANKEYNIYPKPQSLEYSEGQTEIKEKINLIYSDKVEKETLDKLRLVFSGKTILENEDLKDEYTNVILSLNDEDSRVSEIINKKGVKYPNEGFNHYILIIDNGNVYLNARQANDLFYAVTSLKHIVNQSQSSLRNLVLNDYADVEYRGFIEGYYGIPWSHENKKSLMEFGGDFKSNTYIFAPKDDPYHSSKWRELYPQEELTKVKELIEVGKKSNNKFVWSIHPFMSSQRFNFDNYESDFKVLTNKFEQLYDAGVRQFGILADDVGALDRNVLLRLLNDISKWAKDKGDVIDVLFCPAGYNHAWQGNYSELKILNKAPDNIKIFWTGNSVVSPVSQNAVNNFINGSTTDGNPGRNPYFWLNWPVNDYHQQRLLMGPGYILKKGTKNLAGLVTNPMQQAQASKVALFAVSDYSWNTDNFDADKSWNDSFEYVEPNAAKDLRNIAEHLQDVSPSGHGLVLEESQNIEALINEYKNALKSNDKQALNKATESLIKEYDGILSSIDSLRTKSKNEILLEEMKPWLDSFEELLKSGKLFMEAVASENISEKWSKFAEGNKYLEKSKTHKAPHITNKTVYADPGSKLISPLINKDIKEKLNEELYKQDQNDNQEKLSLKGFYASDMLRTYDPNNGDMSKMVDGDVSTAITVYSKNGDFLDVGSYVGVELNKVANINNITIKQGRNGAAGDTFGKAVVEYSTNGVNYTPIQEVQKGKDVDIHLEQSIQAKYIRFRNLEKVNVWASIREFNVSNTGSADTFTNVDELKNKQAMVNEDEFILDKVNKTLKPGQYIGIDLGEIKEIEKVENNSKLKLEYSKNNVVYHDELDADKSARYVRLINDSQEDIPLNEVLKVKTSDYSPIRLIDTNYTDKENELAAFDQNLNTKAWFKNSQHKGKYATYDLGRTISLEKIRMIVDDSEHDFIRYGKVSVSADNQNWEDVLTIDAGENVEDNASAFPSKDVSFNYKESKFEAKPVRYIKFELTKSKPGNDKWVRFNEILLNDGQYLPKSKKPGIQVTTTESQKNNKLALIDENIMTSYKANEAGELVYYIDKPTDFKSIHILTSGSEKMNLSIMDEKENWVDLGELDDTFKKIDASKYDHVLAVKLTWDEASRNIHEIILSQEVVEETKDEINKKDLEDKISSINEEMDDLREAKTEESMAKLEDALTKAKEVLEKEDLSQDEIDQALENLNKAYEALEDKKPEETDKEEPEEPGETEKEEPEEPGETDKEEPEEPGETDKEEPETPRETEKEEPETPEETDKEENPDILPEESEDEIETPGDKTEENHTEEENIEAVIEKIDGKDLLNAESLALLKSRNLEYRDIYFRNILTKEKVKVNTAKKISVELESIDDLKVYHIEKDGSLTEILKTEINGKTVSFIHDDFSPFVFSTAKNDDSSVTDTNSKQEVNKSPKTSDIHLGGYVVSAVVSLALIKFFKNNKEEYSL